MKRSDLRIQECDIHFIYVADGGASLQLDEVEDQLKNTTPWANNCRIAEDPSFQTHAYSDPLYALLRKPPIVLSINSQLDELPLGDSGRKHFQLSTRVTLHDFGFVSVRLSLILTDLGLDCVEIARTMMLNEKPFQISCSVLGSLSDTTLDKYGWKLLDELHATLKIKARVRNDRQGELERVLVLRRLGGDPDAEYLLTHYALDIATMLARLTWYQGQSKQFTQDMIDDALMPHKRLLVLCKWQGKLIYYPSDLPDDARQWWRDADIVNIFELLTIQFFAARMYNYLLERPRKDAHSALDEIGKSLPDASARSTALESLLRVEKFRVEVEAAVHETQNSLVSLSQMIRQVIERYDRAVGLTDMFSVITKKLEGLERLNDVIVRTLAQQTNEEMLEANLRLTFVVVVVAVLGVVATVLAVDDFREIAWRVMTGIADLVTVVFIYLRDVIGDAWRKLF